MRGLDGKTLPTPADEVADELFEPEPALEVEAVAAAGPAPESAAGSAAAANSELLLGPTEALPRLVAAAAVAGPTETGSGAVAAETAEPAAAKLPSTAALEAELRRVKGRRRFRRVLLGVLGTLVVVAAAAVLLATRFFPVLQIYGSSMTPTLNEGEVVVSFEQGELEQGDIIAFYHNNKVLVKRVIAGAGDWVDIKDDGTVYVNDQRLDEPYIDGAALGNCNITLPYQVPDSHVFVMGDHRSDSIDSRNSAVGCVSTDQVIGELVVRVWPVEAIGLL